MQSDTEKIFKNLEDTRQFCYQTIMDMLDDFIYREKRYGIRFSIAIIYAEQSLTSHIKELRPLLRKTDKIICITEHIACVIFDATHNNSYVKAAENFYNTLKEIQYHQNYFIATAHSKDFDENYLDMLNKLFDRLKYSLEHQLFNTVNSEDYII